MPQWRTPGRTPWRDSIRGPNNYGSDFMLSPDQAPEYMNAQRQGERDIMRQRLMESLMGEFTPGRNYNPETGTFKPEQVAMLMQLLGGMDQSAGAEEQMGMAHEKLGLDREKMGIEQALSEKELGLKSRGYDIQEELGRGQLKLGGEELGMTGKRWGAAELNAQLESLTRVYEGLMDDDPRKQQVLDRIMELAGMKKKQAGLEDPADGLGGGNRGDFPMARSHMPETMRAKNPQSIDDLIAEWQNAPSYMRMIQRVLGGLGG